MTTMELIERGIGHNCLSDAYDLGRADAIDEIYMKAKTKMDLIKQQTQGRRNGKTHAMYCIQALEFMREFVIELKEQNIK